MTRKLQYTAKQMEENRRSSRSSAHYARDELNDRGQVINYETDCAHYPETNQDEFHVKKKFFAVRLAREFEGSPCG